MRAKTKQQWDLERTGGADVVTLPRPSEPTDAELVERALRSEPLAEELLYRRHARRVLNLAHRLLGNRADAEDVAQDAFVNAFQRLGDLKDPAAFPAWLMRSTVHLVQRRWRRHALLRRLGFGSDDRGITLVASPAASPVAAAQLAQLSRRLLGVPAKLRMCWYLRHVEGCPLAEVAAMANCSLATAKRRIAAAHSQLADLVAEADA